MVLIWETEMASSTCDFVYATSLSKGKESDMTFIRSRKRLLNAVMRVKDMMLCDRNGLLLDEYIIYTCLYARGV